MSPDVHASAVSPSQFAPFTGGQKAITTFGLIGVLGLAVSLGMMLVGGPEARQQAFASYLLGYAYWAGIAVAALIFLCIFHAARAKWMVVLRRALELMAVSTAVFIPLFIPIALGLKKIYRWVDFEQFISTLTAHEAHMMHVKQPWLTPTGFLLRTAFYLLSWVVVSQLLYRWSRNQDASGSAELTRKMWKLGPGSLPLLALTMTFAGVDWLMTLEPLFFSTIWGAYYFAGSTLACLAVLTLTTLNSDVENGFGRLVTKAHLHSLGKLMLAFTAFWAYIAMSQLLLIWVANLPEEVPWFMDRWSTGWRGWSWALGILHFVVPFLLLLMREAKMKRSFLTFITVYILCIHFVDLYWLIMPTFRISAMAPHISDIAAWVGVGGITVAFAIWRARGSYTVPVKDPFLADSLRYVQPL